jgi:hypothetical protein
VGAREEVKGSSSSECKWGNKLGGSSSVAHAVIWCTRTKKGDDNFYSPLGMVRRFRTDRLKPGHGMARQRAEKGGDVWRPTAQWRAAGAAGGRAPRGLAREPTDIMHRSQRARRTVP